MESATKWKPDIRTLIVARQQALSMATDDDTGLWELLWELRSRYSDIEESTLYLVAQWTLLGLILDGLISFVKWNPQSGSGDQMSKQNAVSTLADPGSWSPPSNDQDAQFRFRTTHLGEATYHELREIAS